MASALKKNIIPFILRSMDKGTNASDASRGASLLTMTAIAACYGALVYEIAVQFSGTGIFDDAYMFVRYADSLLSNGRLSWNPHGEGTYGLTSILYLAVVVPVRLLFRDNPVMTAWLSSALSGVAFLVLIGLLVGKFTQAGPPARKVILIGILVYLGYVKSLKTHYSSGMDTFFAMAYLAGYLIACRRYEEKRSAGGMWAMGLLGGFAFLARPELSIFTFLIPIFMLVFEKSPERRRGLFIVCSITALVTVLNSLVAWGALGSPVPTSFYIKMMDRYGGGFVDFYKDIPSFQLANFLQSYRALFLLIALGLIVGARNLWRGMSGMEKGLLAAAVLFLLMERFSVVHIMPKAQRFYYPCVPAIIFLATQSAGRLFGLVELRLPGNDWRGWRYLRWAAMALFLAILVDWNVFTTVSISKRMSGGELGKFDIREIYRETWSNDWYRLDEFSALPDSAVLATTEIGLPSAMNPRKAVVDLSGLNETESARRGFSAERFFTEYRPDLIYMPHPFYKRMIDEILSYPYFRENYLYYSSESLKTVMGVAICRQSPLFPEMLAIMNGPRPDGSERGF